MGGAVSAGDFKSRGNEAFKAGDFTEAISCYTRAILARERCGSTEAPSIPSPLPSQEQQQAEQTEEQRAKVSAALYSNRSAAFLGVKAPQQALSDALRAIELKPQWAKGYYRAGCALQASGDSTAAVDYFSKACALEPSNTTILQAKRSAEAGLRPELRGAGYLFSWGSGASGCLGHGDTKDRSTPKVIDALRGQHVIEVACGMVHSLAVVGASEVYAWGRTIQCGLGDESSTMDDVTLVPTVVTGLLGIKVAAVACGAGHSVAITSFGQALSWGLNRHGQLGLGNTDNTYKPSVVEAPVEGLRFQAAACGIGHTLLLDTEGGCWATGWNNCGQLGLGDRQDRARLFSVTFAGTHEPGGAQEPDDMRVLHVACGGGHTVLVTRAGMPYSTGSGSCGQLGHGGLEAGADSTSFQAMALVSKVACVACGEEVTVLVARKRSVYTCGLGITGQMGDGGLSGHSVPTLVPGLEGKGVEVVSCSQGQVFALTDKGEVYTWGLPGDRLPSSQPAAGQLLPFSASDLLLSPVLVAHLHRRHVRALVCGRRHYLGLVKGTMADHCHLTTTLPKSFTASSRKQRFTIQARDMDGLACTSGGDVFRPGLVVTPVDAPAPTSLLQEGALQSSVTVEDNMDGTYSGEMVLTTAGSGELGITLGGLHIQGSPFYIDVQPDVPFPPACQVQWSHGAQTHSSDAAHTTLTAQPGDRMVCTVTLRDRFHNCCCKMDSATEDSKAREGSQTGEEPSQDLVPVHSIEVAISASDGEGPAAGHAAQASRRFPVQPDGTCTCELHAPLEPACCGYDVSVKLLALDPTDTSSVLHEGHIHGSPFKLHVLLPPARPEPLDSDAKAAGQRLQDDSGLSGRGEEKSAVDDVSGRQVEVERDMEKRRRVMQQLRAEELARRRAEEAARQAMQEGAREERARERRAFARRTGGGFVVTYDSL